jgi:hydrogenase maturation factor
MCLGETARIVHVDGVHADVEAVDGITRVSLAVAHAQGEFPDVGDWVLISLGLAIDVVDPEEGARLAAEHRELRRSVVNEPSMPERSRLERS